VGVGIGVEVEVAVGVVVGTWVEIAVCVSFGWGVCVAVCVGDVVCAFCGLAKGSFVPKKQLESINITTRSIKVPAFGTIASF